MEELPHVAVNEICTKQGVYANILIPDRHMGLDPKLALRETWRKTLPDWLGMWMGHPQWLRAAFLGELVRASAQDEKIAR